MFYIHFEGVYFMKFIKLFILTAIFAASLQSCSWVSQKWDERPSWMGGDKEEAKQVPGE